ncbi:MAG TPA: AMP-binding protein [Gammaproteobacteria bacterium]|nr:AMP-binding protein [Gammaproteobacteria bacterium]HYW92170.1 AMP-binding protein [Gammaproteobacteria bacterium]
MIRPSDTTGGLSRPNTFRPLTISGGIRAAAGRTPDKAALGMDGRQLRYRDLVDRIDRVSNAARAGLGLTRGERVALLAPNCPELVELVCGLSAVGIAAVMVNPRLTAPEIGYICADSGARAMLVHPALADLARAADLPGIERMIELGPDYEDWLAKAAATPPEVAVEEWDVFAMHYTAGTTGEPKGVLLPHRSRALTFFGMAVEYGCYSPADRALAIAPMFHGAGFAFAVAPVFFGGYCEILPRFDPERALELMADCAVTNTFMVPTHFQAVFALDEGVLNGHRTPALRTIVSNAAPLAQATKERIVGYFGEGILHETYGSTEAGIVCNLRPEDQLRKQQCVGLPFPCTEVRLLGDDGLDVAPGEVGELYSRSPYLFNGYWGRPEATAAALREGWLTVGDLARRDEEGYLYIVDRKKDMIISGGVNVYPREIEEWLLRHSAVAEAAVIGVPDEYWGEAVQACVVRRPGAKVTAGQLMAHCEGHLARYKLPRAIAFVDALPRNAAGKVLKRQMRDAFNGRGAS